MDPLSLAISTARDAGRLLLDRVGLPLETGTKSHRGDIVTASDRASEALIVARLRAVHPDVPILGEENGAYAGSGDERWIVDPLDGTTNYAHGYPVYCVSIAFERRGTLVAGVIFAPALDELYAASLGGGATCNGKPISVSDVEEIPDALVCTGFQPGRYARNSAQFATLAHGAQAVRRDGAAALDLAFVAAGRFDAFWEFDLKPWDIAAGALIVRESGGTVTGIDGAPLDLTNGCTLATNGRLHAPMRDALAPNRSEERS